LRRSNSQDPIACYQLITTGSDQYSKLRDTALSDEELDQLRGLLLRLMRA